MNLLALVFTLLSYSLFVTLYNGEESGESEFPQFDAPGIEFEEIPEDCSGFTDCIEFVGLILLNVVLAVVYVVLLLIEIIRILVLILVIVIENLFTGFDGAPVWLNGIIIAMFGVGFGIIIYKAVRKGDTDTA